MPAALIARQSEASERDFYEHAAQWIQRCVTGGQPVRIQSDGYLTPSGPLALLVPLADHGLEWEAMLARPLRDFVT